MTLLADLGRTLRSAGFEVSGDSGEPQALAFEDSVVVGLARVFQTPADLIAHWEDAQDAFLTRHAARLRAVPSKAWSVYCIFLTEAAATSAELVALRRIEEDLRATRKLVRSSVAGNESVIDALLPLLAIQSTSAAASVDSEARLRTKLGHLPADLVTALLSDIPVGDLVELLQRGPE